MLDLITQEISGGFVAVPFEIAFLRLVAALLLGGAIGLEREWREKPAGIKTHMLVSLAACLFIIIGRELAVIDYGGTGDVRINPFSLIEAVTAGVAFLAAGLIFTANGRVQNVTTGASLWLAGAIGVSCGAGQLPLAAMSAAMVLLVLLLLRLVQKPSPSDD